MADQHSRVLRGEVVAAPIGAERSAHSTVAPGGGGHVQRVGDQAGSGVFSHEFADEAPRPHVGQGAEVQPALGGGDEGDVVRPDGVGTAWSGIAADQAHRPPTSPGGAHLSGPADWWIAEIRWRGMIRSTRLRLTTRPRLRNSAATLGPP